MSTFRMSGLLLVCILFLLNVTYAQEEQDQELVKIQEIEPFSYCAVEMTGSYAKHDQAFQTLYEKAGEQGMGFEHTAFGVYYNSPEDTPEEELKWDVGFEVAHDADIKEPLVVKKWLFKMHAVMAYEGPYEGEKMNAAYQKLFAWLAENKYAIEGPMMEKYLSMPEQDAEGVWGGKVEFWVPVHKTE